MSVDDLERALMSSIHLKTANRPKPTLYVRIVSPKSSTCTMRTRLSKPTSPYPL